MKCILISCLVVLALASYGLAGDFCPELRAIAGDEYVDMNEWALNGDYDDCSPMEEEFAYCDGFTKEFREFIFPYYLWDCFYLDMDYPLMRGGDAECAEAALDRFDNMEPVWEMTCEDVKGSTKSCPDLRAKAGDAFVDNNSWLMQFGGCVVLEDEYRMCDGFNQKFLELILPFERYDCHMLNMEMSGFRGGDDACAQAAYTVYSKGDKLWGKKCSDLPALVKCADDKKRLQALGVNVNGIECSALAQLDDNGKCPSGRYLTPGYYMCGKMCCFAKYEVTMYGTYDDYDCGCTYAYWIWY